MLCKKWLFNLLRVALEEEDSCNRQMSSTPGPFSSFSCSLIKEWRPPSGVGVILLRNPVFVTEYNSIIAPLVTDPEVDERIR